MASWSTTNSPPVFDARVFNLPKEEVVNYFVWRQKDAVRNSINGLAQATFSQNQLQGKSQEEVKEMLLGVGINWESMPLTQRRGSCIRKSTGPGSFMGQKCDGVISSALDDKIPLFSEDRNYVETYI